MSVWYYADASNTRQGPVEPSALSRLREQGQVTWDTLVWREGMADWRPMREFAAELPAAAPPAAADDGPAPLAPDGAATAPASGGAQPASPYAPPTASVDMPVHAVHGGEVVYAGFWKRFAALTIDSTIVGMAYYAVMFAVLLAGGLGGALSGQVDLQSGDLPPGFAVAMVVAYLTYPVISGLYYVLLESSSQQATLGKLAVGIKVTDARGERLGRAHALGRWVSHLVCYVTFYIGYLVVAFTERRQGLHDMVASTLVVDRWAYTDRPDLQQRKLGAVTWVVLALLGGVLLLAIAASVFILQGVAG